jgi:hypothetical protein
MTKFITGFLSALTAHMLAASAANAATPTQPNAAERAAIFKAAGFKAKGGQYIRCEEDPPTPSYTAGSIELADLNKDGKPEAWVKESSTFCYGNTAEFFVLLTKAASGAWVKLLEEPGIPVEQTALRNGWPKIEVGGPGDGPFPVYYFDGKKYVQGR